MKVIHFIIFISALYYNTIFSKDKNIPNKSPDDIDTNIINKNKLNLSIRDTIAQKHYLIQKLKSSDIKDITKLLNRFHPKVLKKLLSDLNISYSGLKTSEMIRLLKLNVENIKKDESVIYGLQEQSKEFKQNISFKEFEYRAKHIYITKPLKDSNSRYIFILGKGFFKFKDLEIKSEDIIIRVNKNLIPQEIITNKNSFINIKSAKIYTKNNMLYYPLIKQGKSMGKTNILYNKWYISANSIRLLDFDTYYASDSIITPAQFNMKPHIKLHSSHLFIQKDTDLTLINSYLHAGTNPNPLLFGYFPLIYYNVYDNKSMNINFGYDSIVGYYALSSFPIYSVIPNHTISNNILNNPTKLLAHIQADFDLYEMLGIYTAINNFIEYSFLGMKFKLSVGQAIAIRNYLADQSDEIELFQTNNMDDTLNIPTIKKKLFSNNILNGVPSYNTSGISWYNKSNLSFDLPKNPILNIGINVKTEFTNDSNINDFITRDNNGFDIIEEFPSTVLNILHNKINDKTIYSIPRYLIPSKFENLQDIISSKVNNIKYFDTRNYNYNLGYNTVYIDIPIEIFNTSYEFIPNFNINNHIAYEFYLTNTLSSSSPIYRDNIKQKYEFSNIILPKVSITKNFYYDLLSMYDKDKNKDDNISSNIHQIPNNIYKKKIKNESLKQNILKQISNLTKELNDLQEQIKKQAKDSKEVSESGPIYKNINNLQKQIKVKEEYLKQLNKNIEQISSIINNTYKYKDNMRYFIHKLSLPITYSIDYSFINKKSYDISAIDKYVYNHYNSLLFYKNILNNKVNIKLNYSFDEFIDSYIYFDNSIPFEYSYNKQFNKDNKNIYEKTKIILNNSYSINYHLKIAPIKLDEYSILNPYIIFNTKYDTNSPLYGKINSILNSKIEDITEMDDFFSQEFSWDFSFKIINLTFQIKSSRDLYYSKGEIERIKKNINIAELYNEKLNDLSFSLTQNVFKDQIQVSCDMVYSRKKSELVSIYSKMDIKILKDTYLFNNFILIESFKVSSELSKYIYDIDLNYFNINYNISLKLPDYGIKFKITLSAENNDLFQYTKHAIAHGLEQKSLVIDLLKSFNIFYSEHLYETNFKLKNINMALIWELHCFVINTGLYFKFNKPSLGKNSSNHNILFNINITFKLLDFIKYRYKHKY